jgi:uncharacterized membrane protein
MALCPKCSSQVADGAKFCGSCGSPIDSAPNAPGTSGPPPLPTPPPQGQPSGMGQSGMAPNVAAMLTYIPLCLVGLVCAILFAFVLEPYKKDRFVRFHAWQSLAIHGALIVFGIGWSVVSAVLTAISRMFAFVSVPVSVLVGLGTLVLMILLMIKAYGMQTYKLPVIGDWADKQANS